MDTVSRLVDGVLGNEASAQEESFSGIWLEYPQYTRPRVFHDQPVPEVLVSGHHARIEAWRLEKSMELTLERRPDLIIPEAMSPAEKKVYEKVLRKKGLQTGEPMV